MVWRATAVLEPEDGQSIVIREGKKTGECGIAIEPLRAILRPGDPTIDRLKNTGIEPSGHMLYFAYGSNMSTVRLRERTPSCIPLGIATLPGHTLRFHKLGMDGSGKCNAFATGNDDGVTGVLFSFPPAERAALDEAEGNGYEPTTITVIAEKGRRQNALAYLAIRDHIDESLKPYDWYKDFVLAGGREHGLPPEYIAEYIEPVEAIDDPDRTRAEKYRGMLGNSGL